MADTPGSDAVQVKLGADTGQATSSINDAASSIATSLKGIQDSLQSFSARNKQVVDQAVRNNADLSRSFLELKGSVTGGFNAIAGVVARFRGVIGTLSAALAGGALFKESVDSMLSMEDAVRTLEITLGTTAEQATRLAVALKLAGSDADSFAAMAFRVQMRLNTQADEFDRLGVKVKDASGNFLPMEDILQNIYARMQDFKAGADQNGFALEMVGRQARDFANEMSRLQAVQQRTTEIMQQFGIEMGPERQGQIEAYRIEVNAFKVGLEAIGDRIGEAVLPRLVSLAEYFNNVGPSAANVMVTAVKALLTVFDYTITGAKEFWLSVKQTWDNVVTYTKALATAVPALLRFGWTDAYNAIAAANRNIAADTLRTNAEILGLEADLQKRLANLWSDHPIIPLPKVPNLPKSGTEHFTPKPAGGDDSVVAELENKLKAEQDAYNKEQLMQGSFQTWSIEQTRDYWANVLAQTNLSVKDRMAVENRYYDAERAVEIQAFQAYIANLDAQIAAQGKNINAKIALAQKEYEAEVQRYGAQSAQAAEAYKKIAQLRQQLADQVIKLAELQAAREESIAQHEYDMANLQLQQQVALRQISADQQYAIEAQLEDKIYALKKNALEKARADAAGDVVKQAEIDNQLLKLEQDYQTKKTQIANQAELERKQYALQAAQQVQDAFATFLSDITARTKSFSQAFKDMLNGINQQLVKLASEQLAKQFLGPGTQGGNFLNKIFGKIFGVKDAGTDTGAAALNSSAAALQQAAASLQSAASALQAGVGNAGAGTLGGGTETAFGPTTPSISSSTTGLLGSLFGNSQASAMATSITAASKSNQGLLGSLFGPSGVSALTQGLGGGTSSLFGPSSGGAAPASSPLASAAGAGGNSAATAALTQLTSAATTAATTLTGAFNTAVTTVATTVQSVLQTALDALTAAANSAAAALNSVGASGGLGALGGGGGGSLFGAGAIDVGDNFAGGIPFFASGTNYVPRDTLAFIHKGEAVVPASINKAGRIGGGAFTVHNNITVAGNVDQRSLGQIQAAATRGVMMGQRRHT